MDTRRNLTISTAAAKVPQMQEEYRKEFGQGVKDIVGFVTGAGIVAIIVAITLYLSTFIEKGPSGLEKIPLFAVHALITAALTILIMLLAWLFATMAPRWVSQHARLWLEVLDNLRNSLKTAQGNLSEISAIEQRLSLLLADAEFRQAVERQLVYWANSPGETLKNHFTKIESEPHLHTVRITGTFLGVDAATYNLTGHIDELLNKRRAAQLKPFREFKIIAPGGDSACVRGARKFATDILSSVVGHYYDRHDLPERIEVGIRFLNAKDIFPCFQIWGDYGFLLVPSVGVDDGDLVAQKWPIGLVGLYGLETAATRQRLRAYFDRDLYREDDPMVERWIWDRNNLRVGVDGYQASLCGRCDKQSSDRFGPDLSGVWMGLDAASHADAQAAAAALKELYSSHAAA